MKTSRLRDRAGTPFGVTLLEKSINTLVQLFGAGLAWIGVSAYKKGSVGYGNVQFMQTAATGYANLNSLRLGGSTLYGLAGGQQVGLGPASVLHALQLCPFAGTPYMNCSLVADDGPASDEFTTW